MILLPALIGGAVIAIIGFVAARKEHAAKHADPTAPVHQHRRSTDVPLRVAKSV